MSAVIKLAEALPQTSITSLECAACERCACESDIAYYPTRLLAL